MNQEMPVMTTSTLPQADGRDESTSAFDDEAFLRDITGVCKRHGLPVCVPVCLTPDRRLFTAAIGRDTPHDEAMAKGLHDLCHDAITKEPKYKGLHVWEPKYVIEWLPQSKDKDGYHCVTIVMENGNWEVHRLHELAAKLLIPNPENKTRVRHKDGNKENNDPTNLEWY